MAHLSYFIVELKKEEDGTLGEFEPVSSSGSGSESKGISDVEWSVAQQENGHSELTIVTKFTDNSSSEKTVDLGDLRGLAGKDGVGIETITHELRTNAETGTTIAIETTLTSGEKTTEELVLGKLNGLNGADGVSITGVTGSSATNEDNHTILTLNVSLSNSEIKKVDVDLGVLAGGNGRSIQTITGEASTNDGGTSITFKIAYDNMTTEDVVVALGHINGVNGSYIQDVTVVSTVYLEQDGQTRLDFTFVRNEGEDIVVSTHLPAPPVLERFEILPESATLPELVAAYNKLAQALNAQNAPIQGA